MYHLTSSSQFCRVGIIFVFSYFLTSLNLISLFINGIRCGQSSGSCMPGSRVGSVTYYRCDFGQVSLYITAHITKYALYIKSVLICTQTQNINAKKNFLTNIYSCYFGYVQILASLYNFISSYSVYCILFHVIFINEGYIQPTKHDSLMALCLVLSRCSINAVFPAVVIIIISSSGSSSSMEIVRRGGPCPSKIVGKWQIRLTWILPWALECGSGL